MADKVRVESTEEDHPFIISCNCGLVLGIGAHRVLINQGSTAVLCKEYKCKCGEKKDMPEVFSSSEAAETAAKSLEQIL